ncbi:MAG: pyruvate ferredoxin oxidoreductase subunit gamma [Desulfobacterota bacterium]|nr:pyruvate ferredoxin oxidoreductase subunit gamma [Thermodesulfobacteriota bacterium]
MIEIRFHGRGGQGAVTSAELLALAAIHEGKYAQAFPSFGPERRGAPVVAFCRISDEPIRVRANIYTPDIVVVLDASLLKIVNVAAGLKADGLIVTTSKEPPEKVKEFLKVGNRIGVVNASKIALEILGLPITNTTMLGSVVKATGLVKKESFVPPFKERFGRIAEKNIAAFERAYQETVVV